MANALVGAVCATPGFMATIAAFLRQFSIIKCAMDMLPYWSLNLLNARLIRTVQIQKTTRLLLKIKQLH